jgi:hypothetical protein
MANREVGGLATAFSAVKNGRAQEWGGFDDKFKLLASTWSIADVASASGYARLATAVVR